MPPIRLPGARRVVRVVLVGAVGFAAAVAPAAEWSVRLGAGGDTRAAADFIDRRDAVAPPTLMFGPGYRAAGHLRPAPVLEAGLGRALGRGLALEATFAWRPRLRFSGNVNFPDAGERQPVAARIRSLAAMLTVSIEPLRLFGHAGSRLAPLLGAGAGIACNRAQGLDMEFPELARPHTFTTPGGRRVNAAWTAFAGLRLRLATRADLLALVHYADLGRAGTDPGTGRLERPLENQTIDVPVNATAVRLRRPGAGISLRWRL